MVLNFTVRDNRVSSDSIDLLLGKEAVADETLPVNNHQANISPSLRAEERTEP